MFEDIVAHYQVERSIIERQLRDRGLAMAAAHVAQRLRAGIHAQHRKPLRQGVGYQAVPAAGVEHRADVLGYEAEDVGDNLRLVRFRPLAP